MPTEPRRNTGHSFGVISTLNQALALTEREFLKDAKIRLPQQEKGGHQQNFIDAVISRGKPVAHIDAGSRTAICCHLMNLAYYKQQDINWNPEKLKFTGESKRSWLKGSRRSYFRKVQIGPG